MNGTYKFVYDFPGYGSADERYSILLYYRGYSYGVWMIPGTHPEDPANPMRRT